eukprot:scaffold128378_cov63-Phaeocystis_antarctica.AAC.5
MQPSRRDTAVGAMRLAGADLTRRTLRARPRATPTPPPPPPPPPPPLPPPPLPRRWPRPAAAPSEPQRPRGSRSKRCSAQAWTRLGVAGA